MKVLEQLCARVNTLLISLNADFLEAPTGARRSKKGIISLGRRATLKHRIDTRPTRPRHTYDRSPYTLTTSLTGRDVMCGVWTVVVVTGIQLCY